MIRVSAQDTYLSRKRRGTGRMANSRIPGLCIDPFGKGLAGALEPRLGTSVLSRLNAVEAIKVSGAARSRRDAENELLRVHSRAEEMVNAQRCTRSTRFGLSGELAGTLKIVSLQ